MINISSKLKEFVMIVQNLSPISQSTSSVNLRSWRPPLSPTHGPLPNLSEPSSLVLQDKKGMFCCLCLFFSGKVCIFFKKGLIFKIRTGSSLFLLGASQVALVVKNPPASEGDTRDMGSILGWGRSLGGGHGNPVQCSRLENPMDNGAWQTAVHRVTKVGMKVNHLGS